VSTVGSYPYLRQALHIRWLVGEWRFTKGPIPSPSPSPSPLIPLPPSRFFYTPTLIGQIWRSNPSGFGVVKKVSIQRLPNNKTRYETLKHRSSSDLTQARLKWRRISYATPHERSNRFSQAFATLLRLYAPNSTRRNAPREVL
jgi:hypothetical protein